MRIRDLIWKTYMEIMVVSSLVPREREGPRDGARVADVLLQRAAAAQLAHQAQQVPPELKNMFPQSINNQCEHALVGT